MPTFLNVIQASRIVSCWFCFCCCYLYDFCPRIIDFFCYSRSAFWWKWRSKHRFPRDPPSWNRIRKVLWELVMPICNWIILIWMQAPVPTNSLNEAFWETSRKDLSEKLNSWEQSQGPNFSPCDHILWRKRLVQTMGLVPATCCRG